MPSLVPCFTTFTACIDDKSLPAQFTFPFYYQPHSLAIEASKQLQQQLSSRLNWQKDFGLDCDVNDKGDSAGGKMFGVLVVKNAQQQLGFLAAFSGQLINADPAISFVPPVCDMQLSDEVFLTESNNINNINVEIEQLQQCPELLQVNQAFIEAKSTFEQQLLTQQSEMAASRKQRKLQREQAITRLSECDYEELKTQLAGQSIQHKKQLQALKQYWQAKLAQLQSAIDQANSEILLLKKQRRSRSKNLQRKLFAQYQFLNADGEHKDLNGIFAELPERTPPAGAGDCAAPKLLQYAYQHALTPVVMAEFWWGAAPKSAIRQHKNYYPSCYSKCQPILGHMLKGLNVEDNPLLINPAKGKELAIVYQDADILVVNKPAEFLSVPGKTIADSVYTRIKTQFPEASGPIIVHRLDMSTSGLLIVALNKRAHKALQKQFIERTVKKRYVALLDGEVFADSGTIDLPLRLDLDDKPRQLVCFEHGKPALTDWQVIERKNKTTLLHLFPKTGRTHQLRVHCAHQLGLGTAIVGDDHYGRQAQRLHLHAEYLSLQHPITKQALEFQADAPF
jgi:tRNA pseudouridine32 synthase/23S rRNA pseudouridine746 synthase